MGGGGRRRRGWRGAVSGGEHESVGGECSGGRVRGCEGQQVRDGTWRSKRRGGRGLASGHTMKTHRVGNFVGRRYKYSMQEELTEWVVVWDTCRHLSSGGQHTRGPLALSRAWGGLGASPTCNLRPATHLERWLGSWSSWMQSPIGQGLCRKSMAIWKRCCAASLLPGQRLHVTIVTWSTFAPRHRPTPAISRLLFPRCRRKQHEPHTTLTLTGTLTLTVDHHESPVWSKEHRA